MDDESRLTERIIGCAIEVHRALGPGLLEATYERALCVELALSRLRFERQLMVPIFYKGHEVAHYRIDLLVEDRVVVEVKSVEHAPALFEAQLLAYLRAANKRVGLLLNFNSTLLKNGIRRLIL
jgi:GxxExxY protein